MKIKNVELTATVTQLQAQVALFERILSNTLATRVGTEVSVPTLEKRKADEAEEEEEEQPRRSRRKYACSNCGEEGHNKMFCPNK